MKCKRMTAMMLAGLMMVSLAACGGSGGDAPKPAGEAAKTKAAPKEDADSADEEEKADAGGTADSGRKLTDLYDSASEIYKEGGGNKIGITVIDNVIPHCQAFIEGAKAAIEENGDEAVVLDPGFDAVAQASNIDDFVAQGCVGIVCETIDGNALITCTQNAVDAGVMVSSADFPFAEGYESLVCAQTMTPNEEAGEMLAEQMYQDVGDDANVVILCRPDAGSQARADGFRTVCKKYGLNIIFDGDGGGEVELANTVMRDLLQAHDKIDAVICSNDEQAIGANTAAESVGRAKEVKCYGFDAAPEACEFIKAGQEAASLGQQPYEMGKQCALDLYKAMNGEDVGEAVKYIGYQVITKDNVDTRTKQYYTGDPEYEYK